MIFALVHGGEYSPSHLFVLASFSVIILSSTFEQRFRGWSSTRVMFVACSKPFTSVGGAPMGGAFSSLIMAYSLNVQQFLVHLTLL